MHWGRIAVVKIGVRMMLTDGLDVGRRLVRVVGQTGAELKSVQVTKVETRVGCARSDIGWHEYTSEKNKKIKKKMV